MKKILFLIIALFFLGCEKKQIIKIAANKWIGYAPLFYADATGCLKANGFKLIRTVSLSESLSLYKDGLVDAFAATQVEYDEANDKNLVPISLFDKSDGADMAFSNLSLDGLKKQKTINVYMEVNSVNRLLFDYIKKRLGKKNYIIYNLDQSEIESIKLQKPFIVITYAPYDAIYQKRGYKEIANSKNPEIFIIDALFTDKNFYLKNKERFKNLNYCLEVAVKKVKEDPKNFYNKVKKYFETYSYNDFIADLKNIKWIGLKDISGYKGMNMRYLNENK